MKELFNFIRSLPFIGKILSIIVITLITIIATFFAQGCAFKTHFDKLDNYTTEITINSRSVANE